MDVYERVTGEPLDLTKVNKDVEAAAAAAAAQ